MKSLSWWDLDKTYLRTDFDSARELLRAAFEGSASKRTHVGADSLLSATRDAGAETHIVSGSPRQMRGVIARKFRLDNVEVDSLTLKPNVANVLRLRLRAVRGQLGYKLPAVLSTVGHRRPVRVLALGDDSEADTFIYSLAGDILAGRVEMALLREVMRLAGAYDDDIERTVQLAETLAGVGEVSRVLIHLERRSALARFAPYGPRVVPFYNYMQAAHICFDAGWLREDGLLRIAQDMVERHLFDGDQLARSYMQLVARGVLSGPTPGVESPWPEAPHHHAIEQWKAAMLPPRERARAPRTVAGVPDYLALAATHNWRHPS